MCDKSSLVHDSIFYRKSRRSNNWRKRLTTGNAHLDLQSRRVNVKRRVW